MQASLQFLYAFQVVIFDVPSVIQSIRSEETCLTVKLLRR